MRRKVPIRVNAYRVVSDAVETGILFALRRAFKYDGNPITSANIEDRLAERLGDEIMLAIDGVVRWENPH